MYSPSVVLRLRTLLLRLVCAALAAVIIPFAVLADRRGVLDESLLAIGFLAVTLVFGLVSAVSLFAVTPTRVMTTDTQVVLMRGRHRREQWPRRSVRFMESADGDGFVAWCRGDGIEVRCAHFLPDDLAALRADLGAVPFVRDAVPPSAAVGSAPVLFRPHRAPLRWRALVLVAVATEAFAAGVLSVALAGAPAADRLQIAAGAVIVALSLPLGLLAVRLALRPGLPRTIVVSESAIQIDGLVFPLDTLRSLVASGPSGSRGLRLTLTEFSGRVTEVPLGLRLPTLGREQLFPDYPLLLGVLRERTAPLPGLLRIEG
ncbi:hypothetical protein [Rathayibacter tanaceti]|uniref:Uncharacterized protein n=2 Tax=Rathayibacter tanaceti TaxID=1671680 RepID=A0A162GE66_9MICO|nr:hypothetical protein [Rathayibacter tanaceti]KZX19719.1 hypothetical protein ACH61_03184 [Rathayibacter tanaceti]QHC54368.1 hypothetical protein GSU10_00940 [Rathayibacter tanaceti]TCO38051.1 hypothetical protein EV639_103238 [Rathayibacter tanaceti]